MSERQKPTGTHNAEQLTHLATQIRAWGEELGFQQIGYSDIDLTQAEHHLQMWLNAGCHGDMQWMASHGSKRSHPEQLVPGTLRVISARMNYMPADIHHAERILADQRKAYVSRYALGRDYHKLLRQRLQKLADRIEQAIGSFGYRVFVDSAPVMEKPLAAKAGLGWIGKHTNLINRDAGSWFFLGEIYTDLPLPVDTSSDTHCGSCQACLDVCPTRAITRPYFVDARLCISYLTIEAAGSIPVELRPLLGNRIYGCDDCQLCCPWNSFATPTTEVDFLPRHALDSASLVALFSWDETTFLANTEGSAIRRIGHESWLRNLAVALGNCPSDAEIIQALQQRLDHPSAIVQEHVSWALQQHQSTTSGETK